LILVVVIVSHPTGNANVRSLLLGLNEADLLQEFHTTVAVFANGIGPALGRLPCASSLNRR